MCWDCNCRCCDVCDANPSLLCRQNEQVRVVMAPRRKYIVIQPSRINKGKALMTILHDDPVGFDLILGVGDERTDEDM